MKLTDKLLSKEANMRFWKRHEKFTDTGKDSNYNVRWRVKMKRMACGTGYSRPVLANGRVRSHTVHPSSIPPPTLHLWIVGTRPTHKQMIARGMIVKTLRALDPQKQLRHESRRVQEIRNALRRIRSCWPSVRSHD